MANQMELKSGFWGSPRAWLEVGVASRPVQLVLVYKVAY